MCSSNDVDASWPHPKTLMSITEAAKRLKVDRSILSRTIAHLRSGSGPRKVRNPKVAKVAELYVHAGLTIKGKPDVTSGMVRAVLDDSLSLEPTVPPEESTGEVRYRIGKKDVAALRTRSEAELAEIFDKAAQQVEKKDYRNARRWLEFIIKEMGHREIKMPRAIVDNCATERFRAFTTLDLWAALASPIDVRLFGFIRGRGRPVDYPAIPLSERRHAKYALMTVSDWLAAMKVEVDREIREIEQAEILQASEPATGSPKVGLESTKT